MSSRLENSLNLEFPTLTICMNPGYKYSIMEKYGFRTVGNVLLKSVPNKTLNEVFEESSFILNRDFEIHFAKPKIQGQKLKLGNVQGLNKYTYNVDQVRTYHHGMCYKIQPNFPVKITPIYNYLQVAFKSSEQRPKGFFVYLTSNTSWQGIAFETWPQINPTKIYLKFEDQGQVSGIRLKPREHIFNEDQRPEANDISQCHTQLTQNYFNCSTKCNFLAYSNLPLCQTSKAQKCIFNAENYKFNEDFEKCFRKKTFYTFNPTIYNLQYYPPSNGSEIYFFVALTNSWKEIREEVKVITTQALIGSLGGSIGMFFGLSLADLFLSNFQNWNANQ